MQSEFISHADTIKELAAELLNQTNWSIVMATSESSPSLLEKKQFDGYPLPHYRVRVEVNLPKEQLVSIVWDATRDTAAIDDPTITELSIIESSSNPLYKVKRQLNRLPFPCWARETVFQQHRYEEGNCTWLVGYSIYHAKTPEQPLKSIRTLVAMSVYRYESLTPTRTIVQRITNINPNGWIPTNIINEQAKKLVHAFNRWYSLGQK